MSSTKFIKRQRSFNRRTVRFFCICIALTFCVWIYSLETADRYWTQTARSIVKWTKKSRDNRVPKRVLVTGAAGFIGFHLAKTLVTDNTVIGIDNFNDYYDVRLKIDRAYTLSRLGVTVYDEDLCTQALLADLFTQHRFTHVVHLAAQAGVRYSLQNPLAYVHANVECQLALLDVLLDYPATKLIYASSSSVYGKKGSVPFRLSAPTDNPGNMYAATKKTDELLALHYCQAHELSAVGLRFFTVYGPWGRPDMAVYKFAQAILNSKDLPLFQKATDAPLERDFTYIDDVVDGVLAALDYKPAHCGERFNLGFGHPFSVPKLVSYLEKELGMKANVKMLPIPPSEILKTWADTSASRAALGFNPQVTLKEGVKRFATWFKDYREQREEEDKEGRPTPAQLWFKRLQDDRAYRNRKYEKERVQRENDRLDKRLLHERQKYMEWAQNNHQEVRVPKKSFLFFKGMDSEGGNMIPFAADLSKHCQELQTCVAFNTDGLLKKSVTLKENWRKMSEFTQPTQGLYVADIDVCDAGLNDCSKNAHCHPIRPAQYKCTCHKMYEGDGRTCLLRYGQASDVQLKREFFDSYYNIVNVTKMKMAKDMIFVQGVKPKEGGYMVAGEAANNHVHLVDICKKDPICIGIDTDGIMKKTILPRDRWVKWTDNPRKGVFVYDIDYCLISEYNCPKDTACRRQGPAHYRCVGKNSTEFR